MAVEITETPRHTLAVDGMAWTITIGLEGPAGPAGPAGPNSVTSSTTSDGTADLHLETVSFNTSNGGPTDTGELGWDSTDGTLDAMLESSTKLAIGEDNLIRVRNTNDETINKGDALVYVGTSGASGRLRVTKWVGSDVSNIRTFLGFAACDMSHNADGYSQWFGKLDGINTTGGDEDWDDGDIIYAVGGSSATITNVEPTEGEYVVAATAVNASGGSSGILFVRPSFVPSRSSLGLGTYDTVQFSNLSLISTLSAPAIRQNNASTISFATASPLEADVGQYFTCTNASGCVISIATESNGGWLAGDIIYYRRGSTAGELEFAPAAGVTINYEDAANVPQGGLCAIKYLGSDTWDFI